MSDARTSFIGEDSANNIAATTNVAANKDGSILERLEDITQELSGTSGIATYPAAAAPANAVSLAEVARAIYNAVSHSGTASVTSTQTGFGIRVTASGDSGAGTRANLFTVTGKVLITYLVGEVTEVIDTTTSLSLNSSTNDLVIGASTQITSDAVGTLYVSELDGTALLGGAAANIDGVANAAALGPMLMNDDVIEWNVDASGATGIIQYDLWYIPLEDSASVAAS